MISRFITLNVIFAFVLLFSSCSKNNAKDESLTPEQTFLKSFAETELPGQWRFNYHGGWENQYDKIQFNNDGIYDLNTKSYYGTGELICVGLLWSSSPDVFIEVCKDGKFPDESNFVAEPIKWKLQYKEASCIFTWVFDDIDFNSIPDHILGFPLLKGNSEYETKWVVSDDGLTTYDVDVVKLN